MTDQEIILISQLNPKTAKLLSLFTVVTIFDYLIVSEFENMQLGLLDYQFQINIYLPTKILLSYLFFQQYQNYLLFNNILELQKLNLQKETNLEEAPIGKLDMNKFAPLADLGEDNDKSEKEPIEKFLFQQNKWNNSHVSQSDSYTFTSQMGENRKRKSNHQKANTSTRQINRQNKFASLNSEDSSSNSGNFSHYQEQPHRKEYNVPRTDHRKPDKADYSAISEASEALQSLIQSRSSSMKKSFKQNNQSFRSQKQTEHNKQNKQNNQSNTEQSKPKGSQQNQSKKNYIQELVKSFNKILNGNQKPKGNSFTGQQNHNSSTKQRATTDQNPYIYIKQCEMNNCFDRKQQNKNNDAYKKN
ncbi:Hypothetical_protein [Hexamita inflata]|uniref:Hypothetical_protein n=2 Tax=Hexamita inflata TaxID=28002 RepID=A0AA86R6P1_9EUKA|nr:Hypothetical protein HINF_LOCUS50605 [Hexamita inflata]